MKINSRFVLWSATTLGAVIVHIWLLASYALTPNFPLLAFLGVLLLAWSWLITNTTLTCFLISCPIIIFLNFIAAEQALCFGFTCLTSFFTFPDILDNPSLLFPYLIALLFLLIIGTVLIRKTTPTNGAPKWSLLSAATLAATFFALQLSLPFSPPPPPQTLFRIAHAGGIIDGHMYTNSKEALGDSASNYKLVELDLLETNAGNIIGIHDFKETPHIFFNRDDITAENSEKIFHLKIFGKYTPLTLENIINTLERTEVRIVTDCKKNQYNVLRKITKAYKDYTNRFIPQIYNPKQYGNIRRLGYTDIIFTTYSYKHRDNTEIVQKYTQLLNPYALTMPYSYAIHGNFNFKNFKRTYAHTINTCNQLNRAKAVGISEIYTDILLPNDCI